MTGINMFRSISALCGREPAVEIPDDDDPRDGFKKAITPADGLYFGINIFETGRPLTTKFDVTLKFNRKLITGHGKDRGKDGKAFEIKGSYDPWEVRFAKIYKNKKIVYVGHEFSEFKIVGDLMFINAWQKGRGEAQFCLHHTSMFMNFPYYPITVNDANYQFLNCPGPFQVP